MSTKLPLGNHANDWEIAALQKLLTGGANGQVLTSSGGNSLGWLTPSAAASRTFAADSNDQLVYHLDEAAAPWANSGAAGSNDLTQVSGTNTPRAGLFAASGGGFGRGLAINGTTNNCAEGAAGVEPVLPITISAWWFQSAASNGCDVFAKLYRPHASGWSSPFESVGIGIGDSSGTVAFHVTTGSGSLTTLSGSNIYDRVVVGAWNLLVGVYDGSTMLLYVNGSLAGSTAKSGAIDYGTHGPWSTQQPPTGAGTLTGILDEVRVASVARSAAWVQSYWQTAMLLT